MKKNWDWGTRKIYTIEVIKWDNHLIASTNVIQTYNGHEWGEMTKKIENECKAEMKSGIIRDYRIVKYEHDKSFMRLGR